MRDRGVLLSRIGVHDNVLKIRPPMPFSTERGPAARTPRRRVAHALIA
jgi:4-aminobutyrate aminotransferase-like enzyme